MNREIKFRGKCAASSRYAGEWVEGGLIVPQIIKDNEVLIVSAYSDDCTSTYHVDADTVCQFTGLYYSGKEVYEHDLIKCNGVLCEVVYNHAIGSFVLLEILTQSLGETPIGKMGAAFSCELVGNIFDDTELLRS